MPRIVFVSRPLFLEKKIRIKILQNAAEHILCSFFDVILKERKNRLKHIFLSEPTIISGVTDILYMQLRVL